MVKISEVEDQEREVAQLMDQVEQLEKKSKQFAKKIQVIATSLDEATQRSKLLSDQHEELRLQLDQKRLGRNLLCKQGSNEQSAIKLLTETELSITANMGKMNEIEAEIQKHESYEREFRQKLQKLETEFRKDSGVLQKVKKQLSQSKTSLEKRSRQLDLHLQQLVSQQCSTADMVNWHNICPPTFSCLACNVYTYISLLVINSEFLPQERAIQKLLLVHASKFQADWQ